MFGTNRIDNISRHVKEVTQSPETWRYFLDTVSRFSEFSFYENLAIHSKMQGARFETVNPAAHDELYCRLSDKFAIPAFTLPRTLDGLAVELARNNLHAAYTEDSGIDETAFALLMRYSFCYVLARKCEVELNVPENVFDSITKLNNYSKLNSLGTAVGSTAKMGAGTNCQDRLIALHDLDCPWRPRDLIQRKGRIERQGNMNEKVHVCRYVTEGTFDAYLWQTVEKKQKFISQIMTSKSPVRSCEDVDDVALSFAEIKALCAGDPRIKERMDLDVEVSKLKLMKADHKSKQFRLEDNLLKHYPAEIEKTEKFISGFKADIQTLAEYPLPKEGFIGIEIRGDKLTDRENAGAALMDAIKDFKETEPLNIGHYRGLEMSLARDGFDLVLTLKGQMTHHVALGEDGRGNLIRIENALEKIPDRLKSAEVHLEETKNQQKTAESEVGKPFPYETELAEKTARLIELDNQLNLDGSKGQQEQPPQTVNNDIAAKEKPSILSRLKQTPAVSEKAEGKVKNKSLEER